MRLCTYCDDEGGTREEVEQGQQRCPTGASRPHRVCVDKAPGTIQFFTHCCVPRQASDFSLSLSR